MLSLVVINRSTDDVDLFGDESWPIMKREEPSAVSLLGTTGWQRLSEQIHRTNRVNYERRLGTNQSRLSSSRKPLIDFSTSWWQVVWLWHSLLTSISRFVWLSGAYLLIDHLVILSLFLLALEKNQSAKRINIVPSLDQFWRRDRSKKKIHR